MSRRSRRIGAALGAVLLSLPLAACGIENSDKASDSDSSSTPSGVDTGDALDEVTFDGEVGESLEATWKSEVALPKKTTVTTLVKGDGDKLAEGDTVNAYLWLGNGTTKETVFNGYDNGGAESLQYGTPLGEAFDALLDGASYGSRVVAVIDPSALFGDNVAGNQLGIGEEDAVVMVADLVDKQVEVSHPQ